MSARFELAPNGEVRLGGQPLHPAGDPLAAARQELSPLLDQSQPGDTLVLAGSGLGWHARAALEQQPQLHLLLYEPDPERRSWRDCLGPSLRGAVLADNEAQLSQALGDKLVYGQSSRVAFYAPPAYRAACPSMVARAQEIYQQARSRNYVDHQTKLHRGAEWRQTLAHNFKHVLSLADLSLLAGVMRGEPALVVGAGPSLDQSLPHLAKARQNCLVLAAASALRPLAQAGLAPHLAVALEAKDESRQLAQADPQRTLLVAASCCHPQHFAAWPGHKALLHLQPWVSALTGQGQPAPSGGHATSLAFSLAVLWGCDPIILVGQDLAYSQGRIHASGRPGGEDEARPSTTLVPAIGGGQIETSHVMLSYISWYQEAAAYLAGSRRVINASASGAMLPGLEHQDIASALASLPASSFVFQQLLDGVAKLPRPSRHLLGQRLSQERVWARRLGQALAAGAEEALTQAPAGSALAAWLSELPPGLEPSRLREELDSFTEMLRQMDEGMHV